MASAPLFFYLVSDRAPLLHHVIFEDVFSLMTSAILSIYRLSHILCRMNNLVQCLYDRCTGIII